MISFSLIQGHLQAGMNMIYHNDNKSCQNDFKICSSTQNTFNGWCLRELWKREQHNWQISVSSGSNISYNFPKLGQSAYLNDQAKTLRKPAICQDISWAVDGTSFVTVHDDYGIRQFLVPELESENKQLVPFTRTFKNQSIVTSMVHHSYSLFNDSPRYNFIILALRDLPLQLCPLDDNETTSKPLHSYEVMDPTNEMFQTPYSLTFNGEDHFLAGFGRNKVSLYNLTRSQPIVSAQSTKQQCGKSIQKTVVSCFDQQADQSTISTTHRLFGTYKNELYSIDLRSLRACLLYRTQSGRGFTQILKSSNGHYVYIVKRGSFTIDVLDTRQSYKKVNELKLPYKISHQKMKACVTDTGGLNIGTDHGSVINWSRELIEFGGINRDSNIVQTEVSAEREIMLPFNKSRLNIIQQCPTDPDIYAISYSPDKFMDGPTEHEASGLLIAQNPTE